MAGITLTEQVERRTAAVRAGREAGRRRIEIVGIDIACGRQVRAAGDLTVGRTHGVERCVKAVGVDVAGCAHRCGGLAVVVGDLVAGIAGDLSIGADDTAQRLASRLLAANTQIEIVAGQQ